MLVRILKFHIPHSALSMLVSWNWLNDFVPLKMTQAELVERLMMAGLNHESTEQLGNDWAIDLEVTSNRPDCLGHIGIAREAAVLFDLQLRYSDANLNPANQTESGEQPHRIADDLRNYTSIDVACPDLCPRYSARVIRGVKIANSPSQMAMRLASIGQPVINNVVDITNYVMMECGQPLHAFDFQKLIGRKIIVRRAKEGEQFQAIDHKTYTLDGQMCVIADAERPVAIGGVMGGADSEVSATTTDVLIEAAQFAPLSIRSTARKLKLQSASSYRFERGTDPEMVDWASRRACELILKHAGGQLIDGVIDVSPARPPRQAITLRLSQLKRIIGIDVPPAVVKKILSALGCLEQSAGEKEIITIPPTWRRDLEREIDLVEEVARVHGYDKIPEDASVPMAASHKPDGDRVMDKVRQVLTASGHDEAMTASVVPEKWSDAFSPWTDAPPFVANIPMLEGADRLRRSLVPSLLDSRRINESLSNPVIELFETARIYLPTGGELPREQLTLAAVSGRGFLHLKGVVESLLEALHIDEPLEFADYNHKLLESGRASELKLGGQRLGFLGEVSAGGLKAFGLRSPATILEIDLSRVSSAAKLVTKYAVQSLYPTIARDLNLIVAESVRWADLSASVQLTAAKVLERLEYLDTYRDPQKDGPNTKRLHFSFTMRAPDRTLTGPEADAIRDAIVATCGAKYGAKLLS
ncbi:MAG TPA: phenylalanine--tRNA ligase subunit beta [Pirellulaceae bacterium]